MFSCLKNLQINVGKTVKEIARFFWDDAKAWKLNETWFTKKLWFITDGWWYCMQELQYAMRRAGQNPTESEVQDMVNKIDDGQYQIKGFHMVFASNK